jgi:AcrR family transcriptional regulator
VSDESGTNSPPPGPARRGRAPVYTVDQITDAAVGIADQEGLPAVTMRRVGRALGTGAASLYRHVSTRDELVALMVDQANGELLLPARRTGSWRHQMIELGHQARDIYRRHPWMIDALDPTPRLGPNGLAYLEHTLDVLSATHVTGRTKLEAVGVFSGLVRLLAKVERDEQGTGSSLAEVRAKQLLSAATDGAHPRLAEALADASPAPAARSTESRRTGGDGKGPDQFDRILGRVLTGLLTE